MTTELADLKLVEVDPDVWRARLVAGRLREKVRAGETTAHTIAEMAGINVRTIHRLLDGHQVRPGTLDRISLALDGHWTPPLTEQRVQDMRNNLARFMARIHKQPVGAS